MVILKSPTLRIITCTLTLPLMLNFVPLFLLMESERQNGMLTGVTGLCLKILLSSRWWRKFSEASDQLCHCWLSNIPLGPWLFQENCRASSSFFGTLAFLELRQDDALLELARLALLSPTDCFQSHALRFQQSSTLILAAELELCLMTIIFMSSLLISSSSSDLPSFSPPSPKTLFLSALLLGL